MLLSICSLIYEHKPNALSLSLPTRISSFNYNSGKWWRSLFRVDCILCTMCTIMCVMCSEDIFRCLASCVQRVTIWQQYSGTKLNSFSFFFLQFRTPVSVAVDVVFSTAFLSNQVCKKSIRSTQFWQLMLDIRRFCSCCRRLLTGVFTEWQRSWCKSHFIFGVVVLQFLFWIVSFPLNESASASQCTIWAASLIYIWQRQEL